MDEPWLTALRRAAAKWATADRDVYASAFGDSNPTVDVYSRTEAAGELTIGYVFDDWDYCPAQSGSDWSYHRIYRGVAKVVNGAVIANQIEALRKTYVHEYDERTYDREAVMREVRTMCSGEKEAP